MLCCFSLFGIFMTTWLLCGSHHNSFFFFVQSVKWLIGDWINLFKTVRKSRCPIKHWKSSRMDLAHLVSSCLLRKSSTSLSMGVKLLPYNFFMLFNRFINIYKLPKTRWLSAETEAKVKFTNSKAAMGGEERKRWTGDLWRSRAWNPSVDEWKSLLSN